VTYLGGGAIIFRDTGLRKCLAVDNVVIARWRHVRRLHFDKYV